MPSAIPTWRISTIATCPRSTASLKGLRKIANQYDAVLIGETWTTNIDQLKDYYGADKDELELPMDFMFTMVDQLSSDGISPADCGLERPAVAGRYT